MSSTRNQKERKDTDIYINPASQEIYAEFYNGMLGTELTWEQIFEQTDRDINLQRVMNVMVFGKSTGENDWIPERAIGPTDDELYLAEKDYHDQEMSRILEKPLDHIAAMNTSEKREILMRHRKEQLRKLIQIYYQERGWNASGIPTIDTLKRVGLWDFLNEEVKAKISEMLALEKIQQFFEVWVRQHGRLSIINNLGSSPPPPRKSPFPPGLPEGDVEPIVGLPYPLIALLKFIPVHIILTISIGMIKCR